MLTFRPVVRWPRPFTKPRKHSAFKADYADTKNLIEYEVYRLGAKDAVVQLALPESQIRRDGLPYSDARPEHPGVILSFESRRTGPVQMPCDAFTDWRDNLRAIGLALEALRKVDRYGVTTAAEQYRGWAALPPPQQGKPAPMSVEAAAGIVAAEAFASPSPDNAVQVRLIAAAFRIAYRTAARRLHPDTNGGEHLPAWDRLQEAAQVLEKHHGNGTH